MKKQSEEERKRRKSERGKLYRSKNAEKIAAYQKKYRAENKEKIDDGQREYRKSNAEKIKEKQDIFIKKNPLHGKRWRAKNKVHCSIKRKERHAYEKEMRELQEEAGFEQC